MDCLGNPLFYRIGKFSEFPIWQKIIIALRRGGSMSLLRPAAGGESCKQDSFLCAEEICRYGVRPELRAWAGGGVWFL